MAKVFDFFQMLNRLKSLNSLFNSFCVMSFLKFLRGYLELRNLNKPRVINLNLDLAFLRRHQKPFSDGVFHQKIILVVESVFLQKVNHFFGREKLLELLIFSQIVFFCILHCFPPLRKSIISPVLRTFLGDQSRLLT